MRLKDNPMLATYTRKGSLYSARMATSALGHRFRPGLLQANNTIFLAVFGIATTAATSYPSCPWRLG